MARYPLCGMNDLAHRETHSGSKVKHIAFPVCGKIAHGKDMGLRQVGYMDVIPHAGAVACFIIVSKHVYRRTLAIGYLKHAQWNMRSIASFVSP